MNAASGVGRLAATGDSGWGRSHSDGRPAPGSRLTIRLPVFEGPLDLLLHLIREQKVEIYDIPIAKVTEQYLAYLALMEELNLEVAGEFLVTAATLLEIKSQMLLPRPPAALAGDGSGPDGPDPREELVQRLLEYEQYKAAAGRFRALEEVRLKLFTRPAAAPRGQAVPLAALAPVDLVRALERLLAAGSDGGGEIATLQREKLHLRLRMREVLGALSGWEGPLPFGTLFAIFCSAPPSRLEIVVTFLAVLELLREGQICVWQQAPLGEILLTRADASAE